MKTRVQIIVHQYQITRFEGEQAGSNKTACLWFGCVSCLGKSTLANLAEQKLFGREVKAFMPDSDNVWKELNQDLAFSDRMGWKV
jgi:adenylylsulfate kinase